MWMTLIVISGIVFMHKEVTSDGEIVTHIHPYDFTKKNNKHHHKSDAEIRYLDVVYQGSFIAPAFETLPLPISQEHLLISCFSYSQSYHSEDILHSYSRGPPSVV